HFFLPPLPSSPTFYLSLHDALPISCRPASTTTRRTSPRRPLTPPPHPRLPTRQPPQTPHRPSTPPARPVRTDQTRRPPRPTHPRSEEHTSELQSRFDLVCRLLLEKT